MRYLKALALGLLAGFLVQEMLGFGLAALLQPGLAQLLASAAIVTFSAPVFIRIADEPRADRGMLCQAMIGTLVPALKGPCMLVPMLSGEAGLTLANLALATLFAWLVERTDMPCRNWAWTMMLLPIAILLGDLIVPFG